MTSPLATARAVADLTEGVIVATVDIAAPPERVFHALTDPLELLRWWGSPETYRTEHWTVDLRVGGKWHCTGHSVDGRAFAVEGEYLVVDPPRKLVQTWRPGWEPGLANTITYRLDPIATGTRVTLRHEGFGDRADACRNHADGWERILGWLEGYAGRRGPARTGWIGRFFNPFRLATYVLLVYCAGHTAGALFNTPRFTPEAGAVLDAMRSVRFPVQGFQRTWFGFYFGFGLIVSVYFLVSAALAWFLGGCDPTQRRALRPITWTLFLSYAASTVIVLQNFFVSPLVFSSLLTLLFGYECWRATRPVADS